MTAVTPTERRARLGVLHRLHPRHRADGVGSVAADLVALHATDPASVYLGLLARMDAVSIGDIDRALYEDRSLVRVLAMRRTLFAVRSEDAVIPFAACSLRVAARERTRLLKQLHAASEVEDPEAWLPQTMATTASALAALGSATAQQLSAAVPDLQLRWDPAPGSKYGGSTPLTSRILSQLAMEGLIERDRPTGASFTSTRFRWRVIDQPLSVQAAALGEDEARRILVSRWLQRFGPATEADIVWWTGLNKTQVRTALGALELQPVELDGQAGFTSVDAVEVDDPGPWVALLPGLDPTAMGWRDREWYLDPPMVAELYDRAGNAGPTIWADGRIVGGWAQRRDGEVVVELLEDVSADHHHLLEVERDRLLAFLGDVRVTFRFASPLHRRLTDG